MDLLTTKDKQNIEVATDALEERQSKFPKYRAFRSGGSLSSPAKIKAFLLRNPQWKTTQASLGDTEHMPEELSGNVMIAVNKISGPKIDIEGNKRRLAAALDAVVAQAKAEEQFQDAAAAPPPAKRAKLADVIVVESSSEDDSGDDSDDSDVVVAVVND